ncbi:Cellulase (glycosyl hydrolase family 5 protein) [Rhizoctonia solani]|uniref:mannan endo-1,4-beta-mannosidase n=1 Tax=Rhizoctonia solani TaxID=456999 RepID=A0A8H8NZC0_9AGAM|nr:Cellulase (glycosyl hydrolase family 5 protein) [Rhizoctonia solani]QRW21487.1 Cellulase (glycosyl hydrolase family 5 protein) [Rhizoctonia solani]
MKSMLNAAILASSLTPALAIGQWGQCGARDMPGAQRAILGSHAFTKMICLVVTSTTTNATPSTTMGPTSTTSKTTSTTITSTTSVAAPVSTGFVKTSGTKFTLNGSTFTVVGSNAYWMAQLSTSTDITQAFTDLKNAGFTTLRTWGFNDVTSPSGTYYQLWSGSTATVNTGADGLAKFDTVVAAAKAAGIRLIIALTNNWSDYGGMDAKVKAAFKSYINAWVSRYKDEPTSLAGKHWELANEPRCKGSTGTWSGTCTTATITNWASEISAYIKSLDPNHLVGLGDEGFYNQANGPNYPYQGGEGIDFDANLSKHSIPNSSTPGLLDDPNRGQKSQRSISGRSIRIP